MLRDNTSNPPTVLPPRDGWTDARLPITMWGLIVWAYKRELVRISDQATNDGGPSSSSGGSNAGTICRMLEYGTIVRGSVARVSKVQVHADAEWVHGLVKRLDHDEFWLVVRTAEADAPPDWNPTIEPARVVPVLKANGRPRMIVCPREKRAVACRIEVHGYCVDEAEAIRQAARDRYAQWFRLVWAMREKLLEEDALSRWKVTGIGVHQQPWAMI